MIVHAMARIKYAHRVSQLTNFKIIQLHLKKRDIVHAQAVGAVQNVIVNARRVTGVLVASLTVSATSVIQSQAHAPAKRG